MQNLITSGLKTLQQFSLQYGFLDYGPRIGFKGLKNSHTAHTILLKEGL